MGSLDGSDTGIGSWKDGLPSDPGIENDWQCFRREKEVLDMPQCWILQQRDLVLHLNAGVGSGRQRRS